MGSLESRASRRVGVGERKVSLEISKVEAACNRRRRAPRGRARARRRATQRRTDDDALALVLLCDARRRAATASLTTRRTRTHRKTCPRGSRRLASSCPSRRPTQGRTACCRASCRQRRCQRRRAGCFWAGSMGRRRGEGSGGWRSTSSARAWCFGGRACSGRRLGASCSLASAWDVRTRVLCYGTIERCRSEGEQKSQPSEGGARARVETSRRAASRENASKLRLKASCRQRRDTRQGSRQQDIVIQGRVSVLRV